MTEYEFKGPGLRIAFAVFATSVEANVYDDQDNEQCVWSEDITPERSAAEAMARIIREELAVQ